MKDKDIAKRKEKKEKRDEKVKAERRSRKCGGIFKELRYVSDAEFGRVSRRNTTAVVAAVVIPYASVQQLRWWYIPLLWVWLWALRDAPISVVFSRRRIVVSGMGRLLLLVLRLLVLWWWLLLLLLVVVIRV